MKFSKLMSVLMLSALLFGAFAVAAQEETPEAEMTEEGAVEERVPFCTEENRDEIAAMELCKGGNICWMDDNEPLKTMGNTFSYSLDEWFSPERIEDYSYLFMWGSWYYRHERIGRHNIYRKLEPLINRVRRSAG